MSNNFVIRYRLLNDLPGWARSNVRRPRVSAPSHTASHIHLHWVIRDPCSASASVMAVVLDAVMRAVIPAATKASITLSSFITSTGSVVLICEIIKTRIGETVAHDMCCQSEKKGKIHIPIFSVLPRFSKG